MSNHLNRCCDPNKPIEGDPVAELEAKDEIRKQPNVEGRTPTPNFEQPPVAGDQSEQLESEWDWL